jgi:hypothetical protein
MKKFSMKKIILTAIILTAVMACVLLYLLVVDFSYDEDLSKESVPTIIIQPDYTTDYEESEKLKDSEEEKDEYGWTRKKAEEEKIEKDPYGTKKVEDADPYGTKKVEEEDPYGTEDGQALSRRQRRRRDKARQNKTY